MPNWNDNSVRISASVEDVKAYLVDGSCADEQREYYPWYESCDERFPPGDFDDVLDGMICS